MSKTNFTPGRSYVAIFAAILSILILNPTYSQTTHTMAGQCQNKVITLNPGDKITEGEFTQCSVEPDQIDLDVPPCQAVTIVKPGNGIDKVSIEIKALSFNNVENSKLSRVMIYDGEISYAFHDNCNPLVTGTNSNVNAPLMFDSRSDAMGTVITSTAPDGSLTIAIEYFSTIVTFDFEADVRFELPPQECNLTCNDLVNVSLGTLGDNCGRWIWPDDILEGSHDPRCLEDYEVEITYPDYYILPDFLLPVGPGIPGWVDGALNGWTLVVSVTERSTGNYCWGKIKMEDKRPPQIECAMDTISCFEYLPDVMLVDDNCIYPASTEVIYDSWESIDCHTYPDTAFLGVYYRTVKATDVWGNSRMCEDTVWVLKESLDSIVCPDDIGLVCEDLDEECSYSMDVNGRKYYIPYPTAIDADPSVNDNDVQDGIGPNEGTEEKNELNGIQAVPYIKSVWDIENKSDTLPIYQDDNCDGERDEYLNKCQIYATYKDWVIPACGHSYKVRREWKIVDWCVGTDTICSQYIKIGDNKGPEFASDLSMYAGDKYYYVDAHECKAAVHIPVPETKECWDDHGATVKMNYLLNYYDPSHPGKKVSLAGEASGEVQFYLPAKYTHYEITWYAQDECWNTTTTSQYFYVKDEVPPTSVCDAHTQTTLDPESCWGRVYASSIDDGSHDNCCDELHFAVADMDTLNYWRGEWSKYFEDCLGDHYAHQKENVDNLIELWLEWFVFDDYIEISQNSLDPGDKSKMVVMRTYTACGLHPYDPHVFHGTQHQWYNYQLYANYALYYTSTYEQQKHYIRPKPDLLCELHYGEPLVVMDLPCVEMSLCDILSGDDLEVFGNDPLCIMPGNIDCPDFTREFSYSGDFDPGYNLTCALENVENQFDKDVLQQLYCERWHFYSTKNECMVEILVDDKEPPVCIPSPDRYVSCDGIALDEPAWQGKYKDYDGEHYDLLRAAELCNVPRSVPSPYEDPWVEQDDADDASKGFPGYHCADGYYGGPSFADYEFYGSKSGCYRDIWNGEMTWEDSGSGYKKDWRPIYCEQWLYLDAYDDCDYERYDPYQLFEEPEFSDNCRTDEYPKLEWVGDHEELDNCGAGYIKRSWTVTDWCGNVTECHQKVYVYCRSDFEVKFPADVIVYCEDDDILEASSNGLTGFPHVEDAECELIAISHRDQIFDDASVACYKILRTWTVIDWCKFDPDQKYRHPDVIINDTFMASDEEGSLRECIYRYIKDGGDGYMTYTQVIKIVDSLAPVFSADCDLTSTYDVLDETCAADVDESVSATDNCDNVQYTWKLHEGSTLVDQGHGNRIQENYPIGDYTITWTAHDQCQNSSTCVRELVIQDAKPPSPICRSEIITVIMPTEGGMITIWSDDFIVKVEDNCTGYLGSSFNEDDITEKSDTFTCLDIPNNIQSFVTLDVWVFDGAGNTEKCTVDLILQDNNLNDACNDDPSVTGKIEGFIETENTEPVEFVEVELMLGDNMLSPFVTGVDGKFSFNAVPMNNGYAVVPERNDDYKNGVSTFDLVLIQKHILGIEKFDSPYKVIAADINNSESVTAIDLVELRKLILNYYTELPQNSSWRFVDGTHQFGDVQNPWGYPENIEIKSLNSNEIADFVAVKVGDVNLSSIPHSLLGSVIRSNEGDLAFEVDDRAVKAGELVEIQIRSNNFDNVLGYQFTLATGGMEVTEVIPGVLNVTESNFGFQNMGEGQVTTSWNEAEGVKASAEEVLFTLVMKSGVSGQLSDLLSANSRYTAAEAYNTTTPNLGISLNFVTDGMSTGDFDLYQNSPNPFDKETVIGFVLPKDMSAELKIYDVTGKVLKVYQGDYVKGYNAVQVQRVEVQGSGILYYTLETEDYTATKKMVLID